MSKKKDKKRPGNQQHALSKGVKRRDFLKYGLLSGAAVAAGGIAGFSIGKEKEEESSGETVRLLNENGELVEVEKKDVHYPKGKLVTEEKKVRKGVSGKKFVMVIDLAKCRNARKCVEACQKTHNLRADQEYVRVKKMQKNEKSAPYWMPQPCFHCDKPPCTKVCPVDATYKRQDGIVAIDNERCIGCRFCMAACPYNARVFNWGEPKKMEDPPEYSPETSLPKKKGTVDKCDFCPDMSRAGKLPHCVTACPNGVYYFGDMNEDAVTNGNEVVRFSELVKEGAGYRLMEELGTEPRVYYLPPRNREFPFKRGMKEYNKAREQFNSDSAHVKK